VEKQAQKGGQRVVVYGGNGFVGTRVARCLAEKNIYTVCVSRTGHKPVHLKDQPWSENVRWCKGDASEPHPDLLESASVLITLVGSPPLPTLTKDAFEHQVFMNGTTNVNAIRAAGTAGIKKVILLGAKIPLPLRSDRFGYTKGKRLALEAAKAFSELSSEHRAAVLQPGAIYGTRHLATGKSLPLGTVMKPLSFIMPWQFISVDQVAKRITSIALNDDSGEVSGEVSRSDQFSIIGHSDI